ncbi:hypothetical protein [Streptomyces roseicoloratus]|uniref:hypothetical protein n=1 Tax=Streptomyces roseicoloratus TaxID=2508722 RepID=UPI001009B9D2|nr:hypothetical protein [Streptomyces roseicoloratus]
MREQERDSMDEKTFPPAARPAGDPARDRAVVDVFLSAVLHPDPRLLAAVLHPSVVARSEHGTTVGAPAVAEETTSALTHRAGRVARPALVGGALGAVAFDDGRPVTAVAFTLRAGRITALAITTGEDRVRALGLRFPEQ